MGTEQMQASCLGVVVLCSSASSTSTSTGSSTSTWTRAGSSLAVLTLVRRSRRCEQGFRDNNCVVRLPIAGRNEQKGDSHWVDAGAAFSVAASTRQESGSHRRAESKVFA